MKSEIQFELYQSWMKNDIVKMLGIQYSIPIRDISHTFELFYEHAFQKDNCIRVAALDGNNVVGFQSFFYWPYILNTKKYRVFQSGNSLVNPDFRGKGIFGSLLKFIDEQKENHGIDFLIGFPVKESFNSFIRKGWESPFNLDWSVKHISILSIFSRFNVGNIEKFFIKTIFALNSLA